MASSIPLTVADQVVGDSDRIYYPGLDGLRAIAIALVYGYHDTMLDLLGQVAGLFEVAAAFTIDPLLESAGFGAISFRVEGWLVGPFRINGWVGVQMFFVLSGFLIATLLLRERERFGRVDIRAFWVRRGLRIWPLYYLIVAVGFGVMPWIGPNRVGVDYGTAYGVHVPWFLTFLGNWSMAFLGPPPLDAITVLWSVCVEEQFYLFVPLLIGARWRLAIVVGSICTAIVARSLMASWGLKGVVLSYNLLTNLDAPMAGVLLALVARERPSILRPGWAWRSLVAVGIVGMFAMTLGRGGPWREAFERVGIWIWSLGLVVLAASTTERSTAWLRKPWMVWLGRISYGIYLFHEIAIALTLGLEARLPDFSDKRLLLAVFSPLLTIAMAAGSYRWIERPFLRLKRGWTRVPSRPIDGPDFTSS